MPLVCGRPRPISDAENVEHPQGSHRYASCKEGRICWMFFRKIICREEGQRIGDRTIERLMAGQEYGVDLFLQMLRNEVSINTNV